MRHSTRGLLCVAVVFSWACVASVYAVETMDGKFQKASDGKLTMSDKGEKSVTLDLSKDVQVTRDGNKADIKDLKSGDVLTVTIEEKDGKRLATMVVAKSAGPDRRETQPGSPINTKAAQ